MSFDIVITCVDWSNKFFIKKMIEAGGRSEGCDSGEFLELKYLLRSLKKHKIDYNNIYIVYSDNHPPPRYLKEKKNLYFVPHSQLVSHPGVLPLIYRESIVAHLHKIPNLSNYYFYLQDDLFIMNNSIFSNILDLYKNKQLYIHYQYNMKDKYNITESCGLWYQSTINSARTVNNITSGKRIIFEHSVQFFDKSIMEEIESLYYKQFITTYTYKNHLLEQYKEINIICATCMFNNYLIYKKKFIPITLNKSRITQIHTNSFKSKNSIYNNAYLYYLLKKSPKTWILNAQGPGISDEYEKNEELHNIFYSFLEYTFPNRTEFEDDNYFKVNTFKNIDIIFKTIILLITIFIIIKIHSYCKYKLNI